MNLFHNHRRFGARLRRVGMSNPYDPTPEQYAEATEWLFRLREPGPSMTREFEVWKASALANEFAFAEMEALFEASSQAAGDAAEADRRAGRPVRSQPAWRPFTPLMAAGVALTLAVGTAAAPELRSLGHDASTGPGEQRTLTLEDGTRVTLNTDTVIDWAEGPSRGATLVRGEAYFDVARDPDRPFTVLAGPSRVRVLGTHFSVRLEQDMAVVGVDEGRVAAEPRSNPGKSVILAAGMEGLVDRDSAERQVLDEVAHAAWRRDQLVFFRTPLRKVARELNRYRRTPILIGDGALGDETVTGVFATDDTDKAVEIIQRTLGARVARGPLGFTVIY